MANSSAAFGLKPVRLRSGAPYTGVCNTYVVPASDNTALYIGDPVVKAGSSSGAYPTVTLATAGATNQITGVIVGFVPTPSIVSNGYRLASTLATVLVADDPSLLFEVMEDSVGGDVAAASVGLNANLASGSGNSYTKKSGWVLDSSSAGADATYQLTIQGFADRVDNEYPTTDYAKLLVSINLHTERLGAVAGL